MRKAVNKIKCSKATAIAVLLILCIIVAVLAHGHLEKQLYPRHYTEYVERYAKEYGVPKNLIYAVIETESGFRAEAVSPVGAVGLMQLMPVTFEWLTEYQLREHLPMQKISDPETNVRYGVFYLRWLYDRYGHWTEACAAYNAGHGSMDAWLKDATLTDGQGRLLTDAIPKAETRAYINKIQTAYKAYERLYPTADEPLFES